TDSTTTSELSTNSRLSRVQWAPGVSAAPRLSERPDRVRRSGATVPLATAAFAIALPSQPLPPIMPILASMVMLDVLLQLGYGTVGGGYGHPDAAASTRWGDIFRRLASSMRCQPR